MIVNIFLSRLGTSAAAQVQVEGAAYSYADTTASGTAAVPTGTTPLSTNGTAGTVSGTAATGGLAGFAGAQVACTTSANLSSNPGFASNGNGPSNGLDINVRRSAMGIPAAGGTA